MNSQFKLIVSDLDGTLLNPRGSLSPQTIQTILQLQKQGIRFAICTGRPYSNCNHIIDQLHLKEFDGIFIGQNGYLIQSYKENVEIRSDSLSLDDIQYIFNLATQSGALFMEFYQDSTAYLILPKKANFTALFFSLAFGIRSFFHQNRNYRMKFTKTIPSINQVGKLCFLGSPKKLNRLAQLISKESKYTSFFVNASWLEVMRNGVSKGAALKTLSSITNIPLSEIIAFGDGENDIPLLQEAGLSFAMDNAMPKTKMAADSICNSNQLHGVASKLAEIFKLKE